MIKVSVMYPNTPGARFDHDCCRDRHMPMVRARMGSHGLSYTVDKGLADMGPHRAEIMGDIENCTDLAPAMQISEVVVG